MFVILERADKPGCFFPLRGDPESKDYVGELQQAQYFKVQVKNGAVEVTPPLPKQDCWKFRHIELRLV